MEGALVELSSKLGLYLALQWGFEVQVEIRSSCTVLSSHKAWSDPIRHPLEIAGYQLRF